MHTWMFDDMENFALLAILLSEGFLESSELFIGQVWVGRENNKTWVEYNLLILCVLFFSQMHWATSGWNLLNHVANPTCLSHKGFITPEKAFDYLTQVWLLAK